MKWSREMNARLAELWNWRGERGESHSTTAIGRMMGFTKNAIVGRTHRLDLPGRPSCIIRNGQVPARVHRAPVSTLPSLASVVCEAAPVPEATVADLTPGDRFGPRVQPEMLRPDVVPHPTPHAVILRASAAARTTTPGPTLATLPERAVSAFDNLTFRPVTTVMVTKAPIGPARRCAYPLWGNGPATHLYCERPVAARSYCATHFARCYVRVRRDASQDGLASFQGNP